MNTKKSTAVKMTDKTVLKAFSHVPAEFLKTQTLKRLQRCKERKPKVDPKPMRSPVDRASVPVPKKGPCKTIKPVTIPKSETRPSLRRIPILGQCAVTCNNCYFYDVSRHCLRSSEEKKVYACRTKEDDGRLVFYYWEIIPS